MTAKLQTRPTQSTLLPASIASSRHEAASLQTTPTTHSHWLADTQEYACQTAAKRSPIGRLGSPGLPACSWPAIDVCAWTADLWTKIRNRVWKHRSFAPFSLFSYLSYIHVLLVCAGLCRNRIVFDVLYSKTSWKISRSRDAWRSTHA